MSHLATIKTEIKSLSAVEAACRELGLTFNRGQTTYGKINEHGNAMIGQCEHSISHHDWISCDTAVGIGLIMGEDGNYRLEMDDFISQRKDRSSPAKMLGSDLGKFVQMYGVCAAELEAFEMGCTVTRTRLANGNIELELTGGSL